MKWGKRFTALVLILTLSALQLMAIAETGIDDSPPAAQEDYGGMDAGREEDEAPGGLADEGEIGEHGGGEDPDDSQGPETPGDDGENGARPGDGDEDDGGAGSGDAGDGDEDQDSDNPDGEQPAPDPGQGDAGSDRDGAGETAVPPSGDGSGSEPGEPLFDPQPESYAEVFAAINAWLDGADKPRWEFAVPGSLMPSGYICRLVAGDAAFGADYYSFFARASVDYDPQPRSPEDVQEAIDRWLDGGPKARWEHAVPQSLMPAGYECGPVYGDAAFGADYYSFFERLADRYDPQPQSPEEVLAAVEAWEQGAEKPRWEFEVAADWMPPGYLCVLVTDDESFGADYYTVLERSIVFFSPQPQSPEEVLAAVEAWEQGAEKPRWEFAVAADWMPSGYLCVLVNNDESFGADYYSFVPGAAYDPQPQTIEEVQAAIDRWAAGGPKPHWQEALSAEITPRGYLCELVSSDADFGADYYTVFVRAMVAALNQDSDGFYLVGTPEELDAVRDDLGASYRMYQNIHLDVSVYSSSTFTSGNGWVGIGSSSTPFTGKFDGAGYTISGLWCVAVTNNTNSPWYQNQGLFGYTNGAKIYNLKLELGSMTAQYQIGGLVGYAVNGSEIYDIAVSGGPVQTLGGGYAGGVVGLANGTEETNSSPYSPVIIRTCRAYNPPSAGNIAVTSGNYAGGIVGMTFKSEIYDCEADQVSVEATSYAGGIVGAVHGQTIIRNCTTTDVRIQTRSSYGGGLIGAVYGGSSLTGCSVGRPVVEASTSYAGGFVGTVYGDSTITDCSAVGPVATTRTSYAGGFSGEISNATITGSRTLDASASAGDIAAGGFSGYIGYGAQVTGCSAENSTVEAATRVNSDGAAGGFAGDIYDNTNGLVEDCRVINPTVNTRRYRAGGFVGRMFAAASRNSGRIVNCTVEGGTVSADGDYVGGFAGYVVNALASFEHCAALDVVVSGETDVGGFGGRLYTDTTRYSTYTDCYAAGGTVTAKAGNRYAGGFVGRHYMQTYINCYAQTDVFIEGGTGQGGGFAGHLAGGSGNTLLQNCYATGSVTGSAGGYYGGLIGYRDGTSRIINCYATGTVRAPSATQTGGIIGYSPATTNFSNCYFDTTTTRQTTGIGNLNPTMAQIAPLSTLQMIDGTSVAFSYGDRDTEDGDTNNPWYIEEEITYPFLHYQYNGHADEARDHSLAAVHYQDGTGLGRFRADFPVQGAVPFRVSAAGAQNAYFPYTGISRYPVSRGAQTDVPSAAFAYDSGLYSLGGVSATGIIGFASLPDAVKGSDRAAYEAADPVSYTYVKDIVTYEITVTNHSTDYHWRDVELRDPLPDGVTLAPVDDPVRVRYEGGGWTPLGSGGGAPSYSYSPGTRELAVQLGELFAHESGAGPQWVTVEFQVLVGDDAVSAQPLDPGDENIRNRGTVSGELWDWNNASSAGSYATGFDDQNTDPVFALGVQYHGNGSTGGAPPDDVTRYTAGDTVTVLGPGTLERSGFYFHGWSLVPDADPTDPANPAAPVYRPGDQLSLAYSNLLFYAVWHDEPPLAEEFHFYKVDGDSLAGLADARFILYHCDVPAHGAGDHIHLDQQDSCWVEWDSAVASGSDGLVTLEFGPPDIERRYFLLVETKAPYGYARASASWLIYLEDYWQVETLVQGYTHYLVDILDGEDIDGDGEPDHYLPNYRVRYQLPDAGGPGAGGYVRTGRMLVAAGSALLLAGQRVRRRPAPRPAEPEGGP